MQKSLLRVISVAVVFLLAFGMVFSVYGGYSDTMKTLIGTMDNNEYTGNAATKANNIVTNLIIIFRIVGITAAILMLLVVAMKYMTAAPSEKAEIKKSSVVYIVGAVILFAVTGILGIISDLATTVKAD